MVCKSPSSPELLWKMKSRSRREKDVGDLAFLARGSKLKASRFHFENKNASGLGVRRRFGI